MSFSPDLAILVPIACWPSTILYGIGQSAVALKGLIGKNIKLKWSVVTRVFFLAGTVHRCWNIWCHSAFGWYERLQDNSSN